MENATSGTQHKHTWLAQPCPVLLLPQGRCAGVRYRPGRSRGAGRIWSAPNPSVRTAASISANIRGHQRALRFHISPECHAGLVNAPLLLLDPLVLGARLPYPAKGGREPEADAESIERGKRLDCILAYAYWVPALCSSFHMGISGNSSTDVAAGCTGTVWCTVHVRCSQRGWAWVGEWMDRHSNAGVHRLHGASLLTSYVTTTKDKRGTTQSRKCRGALQRLRVCASGNDVHQAKTIADAFELSFCFCFCCF